MDRWSNNPPNEVGTPTPDYRYCSVNIAFNSVAGKNVKCILCNWNFIVPDTISPWHKHHHQALQLLQHFCINLPAQRVLVEAYMDFKLTGLCWKIGSITTRTSIHLVYLKAVNHYWASFFDNILDSMIFSITKYRLRFV